MQDLPQNLLQQIKDFEELFTVDREKLKQIVNHFVKELEKGWYLPQNSPATNHCVDNHARKGLTVEGGNIVSTTTHCALQIQTDWSI